MKHLAKIAGLCLASMLLLGMAITATASAAPHWLQCREGTEKILPTKYEEHQCVKAVASNAGKWEWQEVTGTEKVKSIGTLKLVDTDANSLLGETSILCGGTNEGSVGPGKYSRVTAIEAVKCALVRAGGCNELIGLPKARHLPWQGELIETENEVRNVIKEGTGGNPGWESECETALGKKKDLCESITGKEEILNAENKPTNLLLLVLLRFFPRRKGKCSLEGGETGEVVGNVALFAENEWGLRVSK
jgi:hypothetical protein